MEANDPEECSDDCEEWIGELGTGVFWPCLFGNVMGGNFAGSLAGFAGGEGINRLSRSLGAMEELSSFIFRGKNSLFVCANQSLLLE